MDYAMPRADPFLALKTALSEVPAPLNRLGMHSGGEGGTTPALAAVSDAIVDAVAELGVDHIEMLATPESLPQKSPSPIIGSNGPLLNPTPAIRSSPRECVFMPLKRPSRSARGWLSWTPAPSLRRSNWDERRQRWCFARR